MSDFERKRKFLIAHSDPIIRKKITDIIKAHIAQTAVLESKDGSDLMHKIDNDLPHVVLMDHQLPRLSVSTVLNYASRIKKTKNEKMALIVLGPIPEDISFIDEVINGHLQYHHYTGDEIKLNEALARSLNYLSHEEPADFFLRFMAPNEVLIKEGEKAEFVYIVKRGELRAFLDRNQKSVELGCIHPGEFVGEMSYINGEGRSANVSSITDCELIEIPVNHLDHLLLKNPTWSMALMKTLSGRVKMGNQKINH